MMRFPLAALLIFGASIIAAAIPRPAAAEETVVDIPTRPGKSVRALLDVPPSPVGSVILLAGGHGNLNIAIDGHIGWGAGNQLVRTRRAYARAGFATLTPDIAADFKDGQEAREDYRTTADHGRDVGHLVEHMRKIARPVYVVGTSRGALSTANVAVRTAGAQRPDAIVITSGVLLRVRSDKQSVHPSVANLGRITMPVLLLHHANDQCIATPASQVSRFKPLLTGAKTVDTIMMSGGSAGTGDPCQARSHHGFLGQDEEVVAKVTGWLKALPKP